MGTKRSVDIDVEKLKKEFDKRNLNASDVSRELGMHPSSFSRSVRTGHLSKLVLHALQQAYNIKIEDIIKESGQESAPESVTAKERQDLEEFYIKHSEDIKNELHKIIYSAVYAAVKKAWAE